MILKTNLKIFQIVCPTFYSAIYTKFTNFFHSHNYLFWLKRKRKRRMISFYSWVKEKCQWSYHIRTNNNLPIKICYKIAEKYYKHNDFL